MNSLWKGVMASLFAMGCASRIEYVHEPTADLQEDYQISRAQYAPFTRQGVVIYPFFKRTERTKSMVVVRVVSATQQPVHFTSANLSGRDLGLDQIVLLDKEPRPGVYRGAYIIAKIEYDELEKLVVDDQLKLTVDFEIANKPDSLTFDITRVATLQMVTH